MKHSHRSGQGHQLVLAHTGSRSLDPHPNALPTPHTVSQGQHGLDSALEPGVLSLLYCSDHPDKVKQTDADGFWSQMVKVHIPAAPPLPRLGQVTESVSVSTSIKWG